MVSLLGSGDELLHVIERGFDADIHVRGNEITVTGRPTRQRWSAALRGADHAGRQRHRADRRRWSSAASRCCAASPAARPADVLTLDILSSRGRTIRPKTLNQKRYVDAIDKHTIVFAIGPAGTGKTYLAMAKAVKALQAKEVNRIILTRPAVEAGERLGFLPGTLYEKIDPYLRPLYDALHDMVDPDSIPRLLAAGHDRDRAAGLHARPDAERLVHHPGRGAEHLGRADEDVPDQARVRLQDRRHRRRHPGGPAGRAGQRAAGGPGHPRRRRRRLLLPADQRTTWSGTSWSPTSWTPTSATTRAGRPRRAACRQPGAARRQQEPVIAIAGRRTWSATGSWREHRDRQRVRGGGRRGGPGRPGPARARRDAACIRSPSCPCCWWTSPP